MSQVAERGATVGPPPMRGGPYAVCARLGACVIAGLLLIVMSPRFAHAVEAGDEPFYLVGPGDSLDILVRNQPEISRTVIVRPDGRLTFPLVEDLSVTGMTPPEVAAAITERLTVYLVDPNVSVAVSSPQGVLNQRIRVLGEVIQPTSMPYRAGLTLLDAIVEIGGLDPFADGNSAKIIRQTAGGREEIALRLDDLIDHGDASANMSLLPGDIIFVPEGILNGTVEFNQTGDTSLTYTDNFGLEPDDTKSSAFITRLGTGVSGSADLARFTGNLNTNYDLVFVNHDSDVSIDGQLTGRSTTELGRDHFFFDLSAGVNRSLIDRRQSRSGSRFVTTNRATSATLTASPYVVHRLGDFADAQWRYRISPVLVSSGTSSDTLTHGVSNSLTGGRIFRTLGWSLVTQAGQTIRSDDGTTRTGLTTNIDDTTEFASTRLALTYGLWRGFSLLGSLGYIFRSNDRSGNNSGLNGITWDAGFQWQPNDRMTLSATYGERDEDNTFSGTLNYEIGTGTSIRANYIDQRLSDQERFIQGLGSANFNDLGGFTNAQTGLDFSPNQSSTSFDDSTSRTRTVTGSIQHSRDRNTISLTGSASRRTGGRNDDEDTSTATLSASRQLSGRVTLSASGTFERREFSLDDRDDDVYGVNSSLAYQLFDAATANLAYSFRKQISTDNDSDFTENTVTVGVSVNF